MNLKKSCLFLIFAWVVLSLPAQQITDLRFNEILIKNEQNYTDEYSRHVAWIEIFNTAYNSVNIGGCYLTNDTTGLAAAQRSSKAADNFKQHCYNIPKGDPKTLIEQRSCVVFFMDGDPTFGTFHVNFKAEESHYVALIGSDGRTLIDLLVFPQGLVTSDKSFGCIKDGIVADNADNTVVGKKAGKDVRQYLDFFTPGSNNQLMTSESKADRLAHTDPHGIAMALSAMLVVFTVLLIIFFVLVIFGYYSNKEKKQNTENKPKVVVGKTPTNEELAAIAMALNHSLIGCSDEEIAAVAIALHLHLNSQHDYESEVLTFNNTTASSVWGQKHFNFKHNPIKK